MPTTTFAPAIMLPFTHYIQRRYLLWVSTLPSTLTSSFLPYQFLSTFFNIRRYFMNVTINGESYNQTKTHELFKQGREAIKAHCIPDDHGYINKALYFTELFTHMLGSLPAISDLSEEL